MQPAKRHSGFDYTSNCVHCGLCLPHCPTYVELGDENDSPRGRIYLMQAIEQGRLQPSSTIQRHLDLCLDCRACESACPSGVEYGRILETYRARTAAVTDPGVTDPGVADPGDLHRSSTLLERLIRWVTLNIFPYPRRTKWLLRAARLSQSIGLPQFFRSAGLQGRYAAHLHFPQTLDSLPQSLDKIPVLAAAGGIAPASKVGLFTGCVGESILGETNRATHRVLLRNKSSVACPADQVCCGAIHYHAGYMTQAATFAKANIDAFDLPAQALEAIVVNVAGCGLMLKSYGELLHGDPQYAHRAKHFASKVKDVCEFLMESPLERPTCSIPARVTYHDACHLCHGQQIRSQPRDLLRLIPGLDLVELKESQWCCGAAGTYSLTQPEMAGQLAERKFKNIDETGSQIVAAGNAGCIIHLRQHAVFTAREQVVVHPIDLLDRAYGSALNLDKFAGDPDINKMRRYDTL